MACARLLREPIERQSKPQFYPRPQRAHFSASDAFIKAARAVGPPYANNHPVEPAEDKSNLNQAGLF
jgi:hypothetical protein